DRWYADSSGPLFEGAYGVDLYRGYENSFEYDEGPDPSDRSDLTELIAVLDQGSNEAVLAEVETMVDMDEFLRNMAVEAVALHWDGYTTRNNYRLYKDPTTGLFQIIPWGTDQTFMTAYYGPWSAYGRLFTFCLAIDSCYDRYNVILEEATYTMDDLELDGVATDLADWLRPYIEIDPRKEFGMSTHDYYLDYTVATVQSYPQSVRDQLAGR
ncbi:MAG: CotH kinase family protein, partial [Deltaproteobacteria bacterium]|nr:CotH kinase family protein [Deltaproteobacteria bacterium]